MVCAYTLHKTTTPWYDFERPIRSMPEINCIKEYKAMYLNIPKLVTRAHLPSRIRVSTQVIDVSPDVNGDATDASKSDKDIPTEARLRAPQSFAPSPQYDVTKSIFSYKSTTIAFSSGCIRPKTEAMNYN